MLQKYLKWIITAIIVPLIFLWVRMLIRDTRLTPEMKVAKDWVLNYVSAVRIIGEDTWNITADKVIRKKDSDDLNGISAKIQGPSGERTINSPRGRYRGKANSLVLYDAYGVWQREDGPLDWSTPEAHWVQKGDEWTFPKGVTAYNSEYRATGATGVFSEQTKIHLTDGCITWWQQQ